MESLIRWSYVQHLGVETRGCMLYEQIQKIKEE
jgi:hypothetical protein